MKTFQECDQAYKQNSEKFHIIRDTMDYLINYGQGITLLGQAQEALMERKCDLSKVWRSVEEAVRKVTGTSVEPLRLHAEYIIQQQCSEKIKPARFPDLIVYLARRKKDYALKPVAITKELLDEPCGRTIFYVLKDGDFDLEYEGVKSCLENRLSLMRIGHHRTISKEHIDGFASVFCCK